MRASHWHRCWSLNQEPLHRECVVVLMESGSLTAVVNGRRCDTCCMSYLLLLLVSHCKPFLAQPKRLCGSVDMSALDRL